MAKKSTAEKAVKGAKAVGFIASNPVPFLIILLIIVVAVVYLFYSADVEMTKVMSLYDSISGQTTDSKKDFDKRLFYITLNPDGTKTVVVGYSSEVQKQQAEQAAQESGDSGQTGTTVTLNLDAQAVKEKLEEAGYAKAASLAHAYQVMKDLGYPDNAAIGLMANIQAEGSYGVVEYSFVSQGGGNYKKNSTTGYINNPVQTKTDVQKLYDLGAGPACGFGSVQWSYNRRVTYAGILLNTIGNSSSVTTDMLVTSEILMYEEELTPGGTYYNYLSTALSNAGTDTVNASVEQWAEAICDRYEVCSACCVKQQYSSMSYTKGSGTYGSACQTRAQEATNIAQILGGS